MWSRLKWLTVCTPLLLCSCHREQAKVVCEPYVTMDDVAAGVPAADNAFVLVNDAPTVGRFSCTLAIATLRVDENRPDELLHFRPLREGEQARWGQALRGLPAIRDVVFVTALSVRPEGDDFAGLCAAARRIGATLLLVYTVNGLGPNSAQVLGVLYDLSDNTPLAAMHASERFLDEDSQETSIDGERGDHRDRDARYQAMVQFEAHARDAVQALVKLDERGPATHPHDEWLVPYNERWWIRKPPRP